MAQNERLEYLKSLLEGLPESLPHCDLQSTSYHFFISDEEVDDYGDEVSATNHRLEVVFGSRNATGGVVPIKERGPGICTLIPFLAKYSLVADARIELWIENLCCSAEILYIEAGEKVSIRLPIPKQ